MQEGIRELEQRLRELQRGKDDEIYRLTVTITHLEEECQQLSKNSTFLSTRVKEL